MTKNSSLCCILMIVFFYLGGISIAASPDNEVWTYTLRINPEYKVIYAFKDNNTYLYDCVGNNYCGYYRIPCGRNAYGRVCSWYTSGYSFIFQRMIVSYGIMHSLFHAGIAIEVIGHGIIGPIFLIFDLEKIYDIDEIPSDDFIDYHPYSG